MHVLDAAATRRLLPFDALLEAIADGFRSDCEVPLRHHHDLPNDEEEDASLLLMPAWWRQGYGGVKLVNVVPGNAARGLAAISASYILFDRATGEHLMLLDGGELTARRTAAASALAARMLARRDSRTLLVIGAGRVGRNLPYAYRAALPIEKVLVFNRTVSRADGLVADLRADGIDAALCTDVVAGIREADIVSCATLSKTPVIRGAWLAPGQHIDLIGSFTPAMREADDQAIREAAVYIDTEHAVVESGDIAIPMASGALRQSDIAGTLAQLCRREIAGRSGPQEVTLFKSVGSALEDLATAALAYRHTLASAKAGPA